MTDDMSEARSELILYQTEDGRTRIQCRFEGETVWLTQAQMAELFQTTPQNITLHLKEIYAEGELAELQALGRTPMTMQDWIAKLDEFLKASGRPLLDHTGSVSTATAKAKAEAEYARYHVLLDAQPRAIDVAFEKVARQLKKPAAPRDKKGKKR